MKKILLIALILLVAGCSAKTFTNADNIKSKDQYGVIGTESRECYITELVFKPLESEDSFKSILKKAKVRQLTLKPGFYILNAVLDPAGYSPIESNPLKLRVDPGHEYEIFSDILEGFVYFYIVDKTSKDIVAGFTPN